MAALEASLHLTRYLSRSEYPVIYDSVGSLSPIISGIYS